MFQGDGISYETLSEILENMKRHKWSADNIAFGSGGKLIVIAQLFHGLHRPDKGLDNLPYRKTVLFSEQLMSADKYPNL